jgi:hypothetical protein
MLNFLTIRVNSLNFCIFLTVENIKALIFIKKQYLIWKTSRMQIKAVAGAVVTGTT